MRPCVGSPRSGALLIGVLLLASCRTGPVPPDPATLGGIDPAAKQLITERSAAVLDRRQDAGAWGQLGMAYEANGLLVQAAEMYVEAARLAAREPRWRYRLAVLAARRGDVDSALTFIAEVIVLAPDYMPARWRQGQWLLDRGDPERAEDAFRVIVQNAPGDPAGPIGVALVRLATRDEAGAVAVLEPLLRVHPGERYALHLLGTAYRRLGREDDARFALAVGSSGQPSSSDPWSDEVSLYRRGFAVRLKDATQAGLERRFDEAIAILRALCAERPDDLALRVYLGGMYASAGRIADAAALLEPIVASDPTQFDATMHLASGHLFTGALDRAAEYATRALAIRPDSADAAKLRGVIAWQQGRLAEAEGHFAAAASRDPRDPMPLLYSGMIMGQRSRYLDARRLFEQALARNPLLGDALIGAADTYAAVGDFTTAQSLLARAEQAEPGNPRLAAARTRITAGAVSGR